jgi:RecA/RadA recombinase
MGKFDFSEVISEVQASLKKAKRTNDVDSIGLANAMNPVSRDHKDYVVMPDWWEEQYGVPGLPIGKVVQAAGDSDTGKTSLCVLAMKQAQAQGYGIVYVETEGKTSTEDLEDWGVDTSGVMMVRHNITEKIWDLTFRNINKFFEKFPKEKLLFVFDSFGNNISMHDEELDIVAKNQKVGGAAKTNRFGLGRLLALLDKHPIAVLLINYQYDNVGTLGKTQAGGKALKFYTMIGIETQKIAEWTKGTGPKKFAIGAYVRWRTFKNHYKKSAIDKDGNKRLLPVELNLQISSAGIERSAKEEKEEEETE